MQSRISAKLIASRSSCLEVNPYELLGRVIFRLRTQNSRRNITQGKLGQAINLDRSTVAQIEYGNRKTDLFELKDIATVFSQYSSQMERLRFVLDTYFPKGNHGTHDIHKNTGELIYEARCLARINRSELARATGIDDALLWRIESGIVRVYLLEAWAIARMLWECEEFKLLDDALSDLLVVENRKQLIAS